MKNILETYWNMCLDTPLLFFYTMGSIIATGILIWLYTPWGKAWLNWDDVPDDEPATA